MVVFVKRNPLGEQPARSRITAKIARREKRHFMFLASPCGFVG